MPIISTFFGIVIRLFYKDREPPHFHAEFQRQKAKFGFDGSIIAGSIQSRTARGLIKRRAVSHRRKPEIDWEKMREGLPLDQIAPLDES